ncbi:hypothetical protein [Nocardia arthritidis]|uniref:Outer membrane channel protein CpnT-like N-terminal domain-containing protein n=1 Tax=Nocardia arthritidis TaxID=228602 RepID=A0A6G9Y7C8_9NOCA|nr:hypothetical protein [Nocardia arthritidis]QIS08976.1 hypothetical protein F5544_05320 [Nocardia arthritidis]
MGGRSAWPQGDEDKMWAIRDDWYAASKALDGLVSEILGKLVGPRAARFVVRTFLPRSIDGCAHRW